MRRIVKHPAQLVPGRIIKLHHPIYGTDVYHVCFPGPYFSRIGPWGARLEPTGEVMVMLRHDGCTMGVPHSMHDIGVLPSPCKVHATYEDGDRLSLDAFKYED